MANKKKVPKLRFRGFAEEWSEQKLGSIAELNPKTDIPEIFEYVDLESVIGTELISHRQEYKKTAPSRAKRHAKKGDLFFQTVRPYQKNNYLYLLPNKNYVFSTGYAQLRPAVDSSFLLGLVQTDQFVNEVLIRCTGTGYPAINSNDLADIIVLYSLSDEEQTKIGTFLMNIDTLITLYQRKYDKLCLLKKSMLEKMFPQEGADIPEIRFIGFAGKWELRYLIDNIDKIIDFRGRTPKKLGLDWSDTGYLALSALNVKNGYIDFEVDAHYGNQELYDKWMFGNELHKNQILFTTEAPMGNVAQIPDNNKYILSQRTIAFEVNQKLITEDYLSIVFSLPAIKKKLNSLSSGGTAKGISQKSLARFEIFVPKDIREQEKIGRYFKSLDTIISLHQRELDKLKNIKKAFLEKMFI